jgi:hypothetical protein
MNAAPILSGMWPPVAGRKLHAPAAAGAGTAMTGAAIITWLLDVTTAFLALAIQYDQSADDRCAP